MYIYMYMYVWKTCTVPDKKDDGAIPQEYHKQTDSEPIANQEKIASRLLFVPRCGIACVLQCSSVWYTTYAK